MTSPETQTLDLGRLALSTDQRLQIRQSAVALERRWQGRINVETIERFMTESLDMILPNAHITTWIPVLVERLTDDRLRALLRLEATGTDLNPSVLFLCVHNAGRSQMAAALLTRHAGARVTVHSAGSDPADQLNPAVVAAMAERGIDLTDQMPKRLTDDMAIDADVIVTMGCGDACPVYPGKRYLDWELPDPAGKDLEAVRRIRDDLDGRVRSLVAELLDR